MTVAKQSQKRKSLNNDKVGRTVKIELYGKDMIEKTVGTSGKTGRIYLPPEWVGHQVLIVRVD